MLNIVCFTVFFLMSGLYFFTSSNYDSIIIAIILLSVTILGVSAIKRDIK